MEFRSYQPGMAIEGTEPLPDGRHDVVIIKADDGFDNDGTARLKLVFAPLSKPEVHSWPVLRITDSQRGLRFSVAIADALGIDRSEGLVLDPDDLEGKKVRITTRQWSGDDGRVNVGIDSVRPFGFVAAAPVTKAPTVEPVADEPAKPAKPARTPAAKVKQAAGQPVGGDDDVPF